MLPTTGGLDIPLSRRTLLLVGATSGLAVGAARPARATPNVERPLIHPREEWAQGLKPVGPLSIERSGDARFLLVHHSDTPNGDSQARIPERIRGFFAYHTRTKGWPDVAYNFFVDPYGGLWEGRQGSLNAPVKGDATGGSQGFALLCCFIGDFAEVAPTPEAMEAGTRLLAWLAAIYSIDLAVGARVTFNSRGSTVWPAGSEVVTDPIAGHRDMSRTTCPGDALYPQVRSRLLVGARALVGQTPSPRPAPAPPRWQPPDPSTAGEPVGSSASAPSPAGEVTPAEGLPGWGVASAIGAGVVAAGAITLGLASRQGKDAISLTPDDPPTRPDV